MIAICVTNDCLYDQRVQRIAASIGKSTSYKVNIVGRRFDNESSISTTDFKIQRFKCSYNSGFLFYLEYNIRLFFFLLKLKPKIIYACDPDTLIGAGFYKLLFRKKSIYDSHEYFIETPEVNERNFTKFIWNTIEKTIAPSFDLFFTVNEPLAEILSKRLNSPFTSIRNLPFKQQNEVLDNKEKIVLYQGVLNKGRGLECAIKMMPYLPDYQLWLVGEGDITNELKRLANENINPNQIHFLGKKTPSELKNITQKARYGLNLLEGNSLNYYYSLANKFFDYMAFGVPSINMKFPVYTTYCSKYQCGITLPNLDPPQVAEKILEIDRNTDDLYNTMSFNALKSHQILNWENEELKLLQELSKLN